MAVPLDDLPLVDGHSILADLVRDSGSKPFACRIPDDPRLLTVWQSSRTGTAAVVCTYWRFKPARIDLVFADERSSLGHDVLDCLPLLASEVALIDAGEQPLLAMGRLQQKVPAIAEILGMIAYLPVLLDCQPD